VCERTLWLLIDFCIADDDTALNNLRVECCKVNLIESEEEYSIEQERARVPFDVMEFAKSYREILQFTMKVPEVPDHSTSASGLKPVEFSSSGSRRDIITPPSVEPYNYNSIPPYLVASSTPATTADTDTDPEEQARIEKYKQDKLIVHHELNKLSDLEFGPPQVSATVNIPSEDSISHDDIHEANPIVPPEVIQYVYPVAETHTDDRDPDPSKVQFISGSIFHQTDAPSVPISTIPSDIDNFPSTRNSSSPSTPDLPRISPQLQTSDASGITPSSSFLIKLLQLSLMYIVVFLLM
jgi:hypothetical protein